MFRNPFDSWTNSLPKPKKFGMPNQIPSTQNRMMSQSNPWREAIFDDTMTNPTAAPTQTPEQPKNEWGSYLSEMKDLYTRQGPSTQAYEEHMKNIPQYQKPGGWHRFGSALVGAATGLQQGAGAGWKAGQEALNLPHQRAMEEWSTKEQGLGRQAELEDKSTGRRLSFMKEVREVAKDEQDYKRLMAKHDLDERAQTSLEKYRTAQIEELQGRGWTTFVNDKGHRISVNPKTGEQRDFGLDQKATDWKFEQGRLTDAQTRTGIAGYNANTARGQLGQTIRSQDRADRNENRPVSAIEQSTARQSAMSRAQAENPKWAKYVTAEGSLNPDTMAAAPGSPDRIQFERFMRRVVAIEDEILGRRRQPSPDESNESIFNPNAGKVIDYDDDEGY